jgi:hypothetical protein
MALEGTLRDFSLADIFQLIGIQRKTGVLTLRSETEVVTVSFLNGSVVSADSLQKNIEDRLGTVLVKSGRITAEQLQAALRTQKNTLKRLGTVLVEERYISQDDLREALQLQVTQIVYRLFRWRDGDYHFSQEETLDYDREYFTPIPAQNILMEGIRMIDEWPLIEKRIRSFDMVFEKAPGPRMVVEAVEGQETGAELELDAALGDQGPASLRTAPPDDDAIRLPPEDYQVYQLVDGRATVQELIDRTRLGEFDTCRILFEILEQDLIREVRIVLPQPEREPVPTERRRAAGGAGILMAAVLLVAAASLATGWKNAWNLVPIPIDETPAVDAFKRTLSRNRLELIDHALYLYFLEEHQFAPALTQLTREGYLPREITRDPWGRFYAYEIRSDGYRIVGYDNGGVEDPTLTRTRSFPTGLLPGDPIRPLGPS